MRRASSCSSTYNMYMLHTHHLDTTCTSRVHDMYINTTSCIEDVLAPCAGPLHVVAHTTCISYIHIMYTLHIHHVYTTCTPYIGHYEHIFYTCITCTYMPCKHYPAITYIPRVHYIDITPHLHVQDVYGTYTDVACRETFAIHILQLFTTIVFC